MKPQTQTAKHTSTPWKHVYGQDTHKVKRDSQGRMLGPVTMEMDDYDHAIECVNQHDQLVAQRDALLEACKTLLYEHDLGENPLFTGKITQQLRSAVALCEPKSGNKCNPGPM